MYSQRGGRGLARDEIILGENPGEIGINGISNMGLPAVTLIPASMDKDVNRPMILGRSPNISIYFTRPSLPIRWHPSPGEGHRALRE